MGHACNASRLNEESKAILSTRFHFHQEHRKPVNREMEVALWVVLVFLFVYSGNQTAEPLIAPKS
jgi:hypothetical protein